MGGGKLDYDYVFKVLLVGDSMVGKSSLVLRYAKDEFKLDFITTIGVDFLTKFEDFDGTKVVMQIWDTAGQSRFRSITSSYYRGAHAVAVVFDLTSRKSFSSVPSWINDVRGMAKTDIPVLLIGNKSDLEVMREVTTVEAQTLADHHNFKALFHFLLFSAKFDHNLIYAV
ncbi:uncharacterized protein LOC134854249 [Symsagittifera roscoffensis]|uniref:uncharacterized protein LOC134854249 n=1 Tax=Symsagittifera roscoffensis TaxID=84072 RepID=UPI00307B85CD